MGNNWRHIPRIMIAAPNSGSGKTTVTCGIMQLLKNKGYSVNGFKCGPDYIDPQFHTKILGVPSVNLDSFFVGENTLKYLMARHAENGISVIEGVMGYYDGLAGKSAAASAYDIAQITDTPVILVLDVKGMSLSAAALLKGFLEYKADSNIKGVILNRCSKTMFPILKQAMEEQFPVKVLGYLPVMTGCSFPGRHLGLLLPEEISDLHEKIQNVAEVLAAALDWEELIRIADGAPEIHYETSADFCDIIDTAQERVRIAVAADEAFCFLYADNLRLLEQLGAELVYFSPLHDKSLPENISGLLLGGGYPENHAKGLSENKLMRQAVYEAVIDRELPCLAECGGFLYLHERMSDLDGVMWDMAGVIRADAVYSGKLSMKFGYITITDKQTGNRIKGHEFHYFESTDYGECCVAQKPLSVRQWDCMHRRGVSGRGNLFAGFAHLYYYSNIDFVREFLDKCRNSGNKYPKV